MIKCDEGMLMFEGDRVTLLSELYVIILGLLEDDYVDTKLIKDLVNKACNDTEGIGRVAKKKTSINCDLGELVKQAGGINQLLKDLRNQTKEKE